jgi:hypothetical protein
VKKVFTKDHILRDTIERNVYMNIYKRRHINTKIFYPKRMVHCPLRANNITIFIKVSLIVRICPNSLLVTARCIFDDAVSFCTDNEAICGALLCEFK